MNKTSLVALIAVSLVLVSCGKKDAPEKTTTVTPDTSIENKAQSAQVCAPFIKYLECSLEKSVESKKAMHKKILEDTLKRIENDTPARIAQDCATYIKHLKAAPEIAFKNGCSIDDKPQETAKK